MIRTILLAALVAAVPASGLAAKAAKEASRPEALEALVRCRSIADGAARLQCFDSAARTLDEQVNSRELVVVDREQIRDTKRNLFGLDIPNLNPFGGGDEDEEDKVKTVESVVAAASQDGNGQWVLRLEDGATWAQTDNKPLAVQPKRGHKVKISRGALGSYMMRINNQPAVRAKRRL